MPPFAGVRWTTSRSCWQKQKEDPDPIETKIRIGDKDPREDRGQKVGIVDKNLDQGVESDGSLDPEVEIVVRDPEAGKGDGGPDLAQGIVAETPLKEKSRSFLGPISTRTAPKSRIRTVAATRKASAVGRLTTGGRRSEKRSRDREKNPKPNRRRRRRKTKLQRRKNLQVILNKRYVSFSNNKKVLISLQCLLFIFASFFHN